MKQILGAALGAALSCAPALAATFVEAKPGIAVMSGEILEGDALRFEQFLANRHIEVVFLNSPGGMVNDGHDIAESVRTHGIVAGVYKGDKCASACFLIFAAAPTRVFSEGVLIGVHSASSYTASDEYIGENVNSMATTTKMARYLQAVGTPADIVTKMLVTKPDDMRWLSTDELIANGWAKFFSAEPQEVAAAPTVAQPPKLPPVSNTMTCIGKKGTPYRVQFWKANDGVEFIDVRNRTYKVANRLRDGESWEMTGITKFGTYEAVFGGNSPRMVFTDHKETVIDPCDMQ